MPWGISESGYNATDAHLNYQYRAFGVPGLGLKRGLADDLVVAPYATMMALMVDPLAAYQNLTALADHGLASTFGYYEAIDYTPSRLPRGQTSAIVRSYMAHHQGMSLLSLAYLLLDQPMQRRFESDPELQATLLLLQERIAKLAPVHPHTADLAEVHDGHGGADAPLHLITTADTPSPEVQLLSNGRYHVMLTNAGAGYSRWKDLAVTRWREDTTCDEWGSFFYLRDTETGTFWSTTHQPTQRKPDRYEAIFSEGRAEFRRRDHGIDAYTEIVVSPEDDIELRRLRVTNAGRVRRIIEVTSYAEVVIAPAAADAQHPAFSKLFVQTEVLADPAALLCTRRPRSADEQPPRLLHLMAVHGAPAGPVSHETDRARFIGRGRSLQAPQALRAPGPCRERSVRCSTRWSRSDAPSRWNPARPRSSTWSMAWPTRARSAWRWCTSTSTGGWRIVSSSSPGRTARSSCASSTPARPMRTCTRDWPARSSTRSARCAPMPPRCCAIGAASRGCGATRSRATCRSCCCR